MVKMPFVVVVTINYAVKYSELAWKQLQADAQLKHDRFDAPFLKGATGRLGTGGSG